MDVHRRILLGWDLLSRNRLRQDSHRHVRFESDLRDWVSLISFSTFGFLEADKLTRFVLLSPLQSAALTIPSALSLIVHLFPEPDEQAFAIGVFGGSGAIANVSLSHLQPTRNSAADSFPSRLPSFPQVLGLLLGAVLLLASWHWMFFFIAIVALPLSIAAAFLIPNVNIEVLVAKEGLEPRKPKMDYLVRSFPSLSLPSLNSN